MVQRVGISSFIARYLVGLGPTRKGLSYYIIAISHISAFDTSPSLILLSSVSFVVLVWSVSHFLSGLPSVLFKIVTTRQGLPLSLSMQQSLPIQLGCP